MIGVRFAISGEEQYARAFDALAGEVTHLKEPLSKISKRLTQTVGEQFLTEGTHGLGGKWTPLNKAYETRKDEAYPGRPMLVRSGQMRQAFLVHGERELTQSRLAWGVDDQVDDEGHPIAERATAHQAGEGHMPQRKIIALSTADRRAFDHEFVEWFNAVRHSLLGDGPL